MIDVTEWKRRILQFFVDRSNYKIYKVTRKEEVFESFGSHLDDNAYVAFISLEQDHLILHTVSHNDDFYMADLFDKKEQIMSIIEDTEIFSKTDMMQPDESETEGLVHQFTTKGFRTYPTQSTYYYYVKEDDDSDWITLHKTKPVGKAHKIILGSLKQKDSRISRIWNATLKVAKENNDEPFQRKRVEDIEPKACGNNRLPSKAAFDVFKYKRWLIESKKGKLTFYQLNKVTSTKKEESTKEEKQRRLAEK